ncbi:MAG TPA: BON domain-containing protein [Bryobacteraceae bacterium]|nr:BON domain-containing protein [Bryobacteraceae bacterium]
MRLQLGTKLLMAVALFGLGIAGATADTPGAATDAEIGQKLAHEVRMYPYYTIFDNIRLQVHNGQAELLGEVTQPWKKVDLGRIAQRLPGVTSVTNDLKVLPISDFDNRLRFQVARAIYRDPQLYRYGMGALPSIHIIVDNGHVTLEGVVASETDKNIAGLRANGAGLSFGAVTNNLRVENAPKRG